jgi:hypothetical protein
LLVKHWKNRPIKSPATILWQVSMRAISEVR